MTQPRPPGAAGPVPSWDPTPAAPASPLSQGAVLVTACAALWLAAALADAPLVGVLASAILGGSVALGLATPAHRILGPLPGLVAALLAVLGLGLASAVAVQVVGPAWVWVVFGVPLALVGLDWRRVARLQAVLAVSTLVVIPLAAAERPGAVATTLGWLVLAAACMWSLEQDRRRGEARPQPLVAGADDAANPGDLARTVVLAVAVGVVAALLLSAPSCNLPFRMPGNGEPRGPVEVRPGNPGDDPGSYRPTDTTIVDGAPSDGTGDRPGDQPPPRPPSKPRLSAWWLLLVVALAALAAWFWWRRGRTPPGGPPDREWALALVEQIDDAGRARGRSRGDATTIRHHTEDLAGSVLPDERLLAVGRVLDGALFGHAPVSARTRLWAQSVVDEVIEANPPPGRRSR